MMMTLIHNYSPPSECLVCPFFMIHVANAGKDSSLECRLVHKKVSVNELHIFQNKRLDDCPMEEIE